MTLKTHVLRRCEGETVEITEVREEIGKHLQQSQLEVTMDLSLERDLDIQVQVQPQPEGIALATAAAALWLLLLLHGLAADLTEGVLGAAAEALGRLVHRSALLPLHHLLVLLAVAAVGPLRRRRLLLLGARFFGGLLVDGLLLLPAGLATFLGRHIDLGGEGVLVVFKGVSSEKLVVVVDCLRAGQLKREDFVLFDDYTDGDNSYGA